MLKVGGMGHSSIQGSSEEINVARGDRVALWPVAEQGADAVVGGQALRQRLDRPGVAAAGGFIKQPFIAMVCRAVAKLSPSGAPMRLSDMARSSAARTQVKSATSTAQSAAGRTPEALSTRCKQAATSLGLSSFSRHARMLNGPPEPAVMAAASMWSSCAQLFGGGGSVGGGDVLIVVLVRADR